MPSVDKETIERLHELTRKVSVLNDRKAREINNRPRLPKLKTTNVISRFGIRNGMQKAEINMLLNDTLDHPMVLDAIDQLITIAKMVAPPETCVQIEAYKEKDREARRALVEYEATTYPLIDSLDKKISEIKNDAIVIDTAKKFIYDMIDEIALGTVETKLVHKFVLHIKNIFRILSSEEHAEANSVVIPYKKMFIEYHPNNIEKIGFGQAGTVLVWAINLDKNEEK